LISATLKTLPSVEVSSNLFNTSQHFTTLHNTSCGIAPAILSVAEFKGGAGVEIPYFNL
jgi:hypothetical protein